jgi:glycosyltransferase involved in cell wall biosynthesis
LPDLPPKITVVMGACNDADKLSGSIDSVLSQTFGDFEFIIVNDGSTEIASRRILDSYLARDSRLRVFHKENEGLTRALIDGCDAARGDYIARIDVGDVMLPERLELQGMVLDRHADVGFVSCWTDFCAPEWEFLWTSKGESEGGKPVDMVKKYHEHEAYEDITHHGSVMFRKSTYEEAGGYRRQFYYGQDWDLWYRMAEKSKFYLIPRVLYRVRIFPTGISMTDKDMQDKIAEYSKRAFFARLKGEDESPYLSRAAAITPRSRKKGNKSLEPGYYFIAENLRHRDKRLSRKYFYKAIRENMFQIRSWIRLIQTYL